MIVSTLSILGVIGTLLMTPIFNASTTLIIQWLPGLIPYSQWVTPADKYDEYISPIPDEKSCV